MNPQTSASQRCQPPASSTTPAKVWDRSFNKSLHRTLIFLRSRSASILSYPVICAHHFDGAWAALYALLFLSLSCIDATAIHCPYRYSDPNGRTLFKVYSTSHFSFSPGRRMRAWDFLWIILQYSYAGFRNKTPLFSCRVLFVSKIMEKNMEIKGLG